VDNNNLPDYNEYQYNYSTRHSKDKEINVGPNEKETLTIEYFPATRYTLNGVITWVEKNLGRDYIASITVHGIGGRARESRDENVIGEMYISTYSSDYLDTLYDRVSGEVTTATMDLDEEESEAWDWDDEDDMGMGALKLSNDKAHYDILTITDQYRPSIIRSGIKDDTLANFVGVTHYSVAIRYVPGTLQ
jgi:hypothetical protein